MKVASNKLSDLYRFYVSALSAIYETGELQAIFELVCEKYLGFSKMELRQKMHEPVNQSDLLKIYDAGKALATGMPVQQVLKEAFFYDAWFDITPDVLIPRPETEELVDLVLKTDLSGYNPLTILDIGTGSGCIPVTLKKHLPAARVSAVDVSEKALQLARHNAAKHGVNVHFVKQDILANDAASALSAPFSLIVSNPPYIALQEASLMEARVLQHEPHLALFVEGPDPIMFYKRIIDLCGQSLAPGGYLFFELNPLFAFDVKNYANSVNLFNFALLMPDMSGKDRFLKAQKL